ncbi:hypothetical protein BC937DRAFT_93183 [Endogone sp. FLAS-F59071]|nr:hypothetical protein BC937DRAFT_93183 [Endogone sp. FLAS-F59071]|eukprot:RUS14890.1 hypothetical protein BC937DRAFT_93183 [Endogone sp. FLAS-F59071]
MARLERLKDELKAGNQGRESNTNGLHQNKLSFDDKEMLDQSITTTKQPKKASNSSMVSTFFYNDGDLDPDTLKFHIHWLAETPCAGLVILGSNGEGRPSTARVSYPVHPIPPNPRILTMPYFQPLQAAHLSDIERTRVLRAAKSAALSGPRHHRRGGRTVDACYHPKLHLRRTEWCRLCACPPAELLQVTDGFRGTI